MARLLVMILLALFLLAVAPAQAARFTNHAGGLRARIGEAPALEAAQVSAEENWRSNAVVEEMFGRMALQVTDYPGSGPNDRHTPKAPDP
ncbi:uncharacterized protein [Zea mays]|uniref:uncharacterized protein n=1 Tax=Zea mays TaxID=4577 RepID=UPI0009AA67DF|nr:uncharacterized protein LOC109940736 [Zea mays]|eukprot:XP_020396362.1 uncharacterized protein LOC109940736 [Zea mays]